MDIDFFKKIIDTFGHIEGDNDLKNCATIITNSLDGEGFISRYGGDEFAIVISNCTQEKNK